MKKTYVEDCTQPKPLSLLTNFDSIKVEVEIAEIAMDMAHMQKFTV